MTTWRLSKTEKKQNPRGERAFSVTFLVAECIMGEKEGGERGARKGKHADSRCRGEPRDGGVDCRSRVERASGEVVGEGEGMTTGRTGEDGRGQKGAVWLS